MIEVAAQPVRSIGPSTFEGLAPAAYMGMRDHDTFGWVWLQFDTDTPFTDAEVAAIRDRVGGMNDNAEVLRQRLRAAWQANRNYLELVAPDAAQVRQQVNALTRQMNALIRFALSDLDGTE